MPPWRPPATKSGRNWRAGARLREIVLPYSSSAGYSSSTGWRFPPLTRLFPAVCADGFPAANLVRHPLPVARWIAFGSDKVWRTDGQFILDQVFSARNVRPVLPQRLGNP